MVYHIYSSSDGELLRMRASYHISASSRSRGVIVQKSSLCNAFKAPMTKILYGGCHEQNRHYAVAGQQGELTFLLSSMGLPCIAKDFSSGSSWRDRTWPTNNSHERTHETGRRGAHVAKV